MVYGIEHSILGSEAIPDKGCMAVKAAKKKDRAAVALGRKRGKKGGPARAAKLTPKQRSESARKAVQARGRRPKRVRTI
jgi:hypothetical protein